MCVCGKGEEGRVENKCATGLKTAPPSSYPPPTWNSTMTRCRYVNSVG